MRAVTRVEAVPGLRCRVGEDALKTFVRPFLGLAFGALVAGCSHGISSVAPTGAMSNQNVARPSLTSHPLYLGAVRPDGSAEVCAPAQPGFARCLALVRLDASGAVSPNLTGYGPADLIAAYNVPTTGGSGQTLGIVDAFDDPNAEADLKHYRAHFGLSPCTTANGCFKKVNEAGKASPLPPTDVQWASEISLDLDMSSAMCPACHILLVEANTNSDLNLGKSVDTAVRLGANTVSNSYGTGSETGYSVEPHYNHPGHIILASAGDSGFGPQFPADSPHVVSVGGTTLLRAANARGWTETVWPGTGSGCSARAPKPAWQTDTGCSMRTLTDVAAVADSNPGVIVYDSFGLPAGFYDFGGTSVASPLIGAIYGLAGNAATLNYARSLYTSRSKLFDVTKGTNGTCSPAYLCTGEPGYDGPTGNGTPNGISAF